MHNNHTLTLSAKTRFFNVLRLIFKNPQLESFLVKKTMNRDPDSFWARVCPPNYLYKSGSRRLAMRHGINYELDISDYVEHSIYYGFNDSSIDELVSLSQNSRTIIDIGANIGLTVLNFAKSSPGAQIIGFEPDTDNFQKALSNLAVNSFKNIQIFNNGLGEVAARLKLSKVNNKNAGMNRILPDQLIGNDSEGYQFSEIEVVKLDDFVMEHSLSNIDLIKIDVEGYELKVLKGTEKVLRKFQPLLFIELDDNNLREQDSTAVQLLEYLETFGYEFERVDTKTEITSTDSFENCHFDIICRVC